MCCTSKVIGPKGPKAHNIIYINILFIHLETQYAKTHYKNEIYVKNWVRRTWTEKVNPMEKSTVKVNGLVNDDVSRYRGR